jgi:hypothetical protein
VEIFRLVRHRGAKRGLRYPGTMTITTVNQEATSFSYTDATAAAAPPRPPSRASEEDSTTSETRSPVKQAAAEEQASTIDSHEIANEDFAKATTVSPNHDSEPDPNPEIDLKTSTTEENEEGKSDEGEEEEEQSSSSSYSNPHPPSPPQKVRGIKDVETLLSLLLEQNRFLIEHMAEQNKTLLDHTRAPPIVLCGADQKSGDSGSQLKKKKGGESGGAKSATTTTTTKREKGDGKSLLRNADAIVRRILRIVSIVLLVVIAMKLGSIRGGEDDHSSRRRTGSFRWY